MELLSGTWVALCGLAFGLGTRHGFDADHLTVIDGIARRNIMNQPRVARFAGFLFALGHGAVVLVAAFAAISLASQWHTPAWLEFTGTAISVVFLLGLAAVNLRSAWITPQNELASPIGFKSRLFGSVTANDHPLAIAGVGVLFAISFDTLSQAAAISLAATHFGGLARALFASGCFMLGMLTTTGLNGLWIAHLIRTANRRAALASRIMTTAIGLLNLVIGLFALARLLSPAAGILGGRSGALISAGVIAGTILAFIVAMRIDRRSKSGSIGLVHAKRRGAYAVGAALVLTGTAAPGSAHAQEPDANLPKAADDAGAKKLKVAPVSSDDANTIIVYGRAIDLIGIAQSGSQGTVGYKDFENRPLSRVGELVENVPGLIATQHSGSGKANQYFLRGFNLDHGTDLAGFVDGVPINMRTHGHGQGYMDLNFLIPELVEKIDYRKGPYFADVGDFSAAGTIKFKTIDTLARPIAEAQIGSYGYYRALLAGSIKLGDGDLLAGINGTLSNGPWDLDEKLKKVNALVKYSGGDTEHGYNVEFNGYRSTWQSTDQVPQRAIDSGLIGRFGNIDRYLGGETTRLSLSGTGHYGRTEISAFGLYYKFRLTSNFTYFLDDPVHGDEFQQKDERGVFGGSIKHVIPTTLFGRNLTLTFGGDTRYDHIGKVGLYHSEFGKIIGTVRQDRVDEYSGALYGEGELAITDRLRATVGLRGDIVGWNVHADDPRNGGKGHDSIALPKAAVAWRPVDHLELYANYGQSYHSNDVRGATLTVDPGTDNPATRTRVLARATGYEVGGRVDFAQFNATLVAYSLKLKSELVFGGDSGTTEPQGATRRYGGEASLFWRPLRWLTLDGSGGITHARFIDAPGQDRIPNSVSLVVAGGGTIALTNDIAVTARVRHFGSAPLIEDNSARSRPTTLVNAGAYWQIGRAKLAVDVLNVFGARDNDITYFYTSRLQGEPTEGVDDYHLHPVEPRQVRVSARYSF